MGAMDISEFASLLRHYRRRSGLTQGELAERAGISLASVSLLERGLTRLPHKDTVQFLIGALELAPDEATMLSQAARHFRSTVADAVVTASLAPAKVPSPAPPGERTLLAIPSYRLSTPLTPLLGREHEEASVVHLLSQERVRLLTLTGPAGVGKTRLALQVAATLRDQQNFELVLVDLVAVSSADQVPQAIAQALGVRQAGDLPLLDAMIAEVGSRHFLLVLDNFEHLLAAAPLCAALLGACPQAKALVTSRARLNIRGEHEFIVPPLRVPDLHRLPSITDLEQFGAVALFIEQARAARPDFALNTAERGRLIATICVRLDGLPLAIELVAAQIRHSSLEELALRLHSSTSLDLLVGGPRDLADHQRTMRSTVAWSYSLLTVTEQRVFRALGIFSGGAIVDGIQIVSGLDEETVAVSLVSLVDASLVRRLDPPDDQPGETRYDLVVIVRAFAAELLHEADEFETAQQNLADYITGLVEQLDPNAMNVQTAWLNRLLQEHDNLRMVLEWLLESGRLLMALRLSARLRAFWEQRGLIAEGAEWLERLLARTEPASKPEEIDAQIEAWKVLVVMYHRLWHFQQAVAAAERLLALTREQGNPSKVAAALHYLANPLGQLGEFNQAEAMLVESLKINRAAQEKSAEMVTLINLGELRCLQGRYEEALALGEEALAISRSLAGQDPSRALILANLGEYFIMMDRPAEARRILLESQQVFEAYDQPSSLALYNLGRSCWRLDAFDEAMDYLERATRLVRQQDDIAALVQELCIVAGVALDQGNLTLAQQTIDEATSAQVRVSDQRVRWRVVERLARYMCYLNTWEAGICLYAAAEQGRSRTRDLVDPAEHDLRAQDRAAALDALGSEAYAAAEQAGCLLSLPQAIELAHTKLAQTLPEAH